jgi:hypothetical protein
MLYFFAFVYLALAMYLYQVVPQTYGVPKKWNYLCNRDKKKNSQQSGEPAMIGASQEAEQSDED